MAAEFLPPIFISLIGLILPFITLSLFFKYIENEKIS